MSNIVLFLTNQIADILYVSNNTVSATSKILNLPHTRIFKSNFISLFTSFLKPGFPFFTKFEKGS